MRLRARVAIDLGTVNTLVWVGGRGLVVEEPSAVAVDRGTGGVVAVGAEADALAGKEPQDTEVLFPLRDGVIADLDATAAMLHAFLRRALRWHWPLRPAALVCVPSGATWVERRAVVAVAQARRPRCQVDLVDEAVAAAAGAGCDLSGGAGAFIVDVGGGTTEVAVLAGMRVVRAESMRIGGNAMDEAIIRAAHTQLGLIIGRNAARRLKGTLGLTGGATGWAEVVGIDLATRSTRVEQVSGALVAMAIEPAVAAMANAVQQLLNDLPPDLAEDVVRGKILLAGGGAMLPGLASRIETAAGVGAMVVDDPLRCVVRGAAELMSRGQG